MGTPCDCLVAGSWDLIVSAVTKLILPTDRSIASFGLAPPRPLSFGLGKLGDFKGDAFCDLFDPSRIVRSIICCAPVRALGGRLSRVLSSYSQPSGRPPPPISALGQFETRRAELAAGITDPPSGFAPCDRHVGAKGRKERFAMRCRRSDTCSMSALARPQEAVNTSAAPC